MNLPFLLESFVRLAALVLQWENGACGGGRYIRGNALLFALLAQPLDWFNREFVGPWLSFTFALAHQWHDVWSWVGF